MIELPSGELVAIWKIYCDETLSVTAKESVLLSHGTFSDKNICLGLALYLAKNNFVCWIVEWRDHGSSSRTEKPFDFENIANEEMSAAVQFVLKQNASRSMSFVGHSGAGIALIIYLIRNPEMKKYFRRLVLIGCQATGSANSFRNRIVIGVGQLVSSALGITPGRCLKLGPCDEKHFIMNQWYNWNLSGKFLSSDGLDFKPEMNSISTPTLSIAGGGDKLIAPQQGCSDFLSSLGGLDNQFVYCGKETGFAKNYSHSELLHSKDARREIWPLIEKWLRHV